MPNVSRDHFGIGTKPNLSKGSPMSKWKPVAEAILAEADKHGFAVVVRGEILTLMKDIATNDSESFNRADSTYFSVMAKLPVTRPGSTWGTDGGSVGGLSAMRSGRFVMNKSGGNKLVLKELAKLANQRGNYF